MGESIFVGGGGENYAAAQNLALNFGNRHGLIAGATGTGKTITLQILAEGFSAAGVPVFLADVKGDMSGIGAAGSEASKLHEPFQARARQIGYELTYRAFPVTYWDVFGQQGHPIRATVSEMGPLLLARILDLNDAQEGVLNVAFRLADEEQLPLVDMKDLQALMVFIGEHASEISTRYGLVATSSIGAIQRQLLVLENAGAVPMFGEPALDLADLMRLDASGAGMINVLAADKLMLQPRLYAIFLLWLLSEMFETLPEVGDPDRPRLVFFFDEAHLLFNDAPKALVSKVEQVARLIRSKGVGVYFATQNPADVPDTILGQLGNRVQHALRAFTAKDQRDLAKAAETYRPNPRFKIEDTIRDLGTGEAVTSFLEGKGVPGVAERTLIRAPSSQVGPIDPAARKALMDASAMAGKYNQTVDRDSAYERLRARAAPTEATGGVVWPGQTAPAPGDAFNKAKRIGTNAPAEPAKPAPKPAARRSDTLAETMMKSFGRQVATQAGRAFIRGIFGTLRKG
jgi:DNA helicase HerA-like ATPase